MDAMLFNRHISVWSSLLWINFSFNIVIKVDIITKKIWYIDLTNSSKNHTIPNIQQFYNYQKLWINSLPHFAIFLNLSSLYILSARMDILILRQPFWKGLMMWPIQQNHQGCPVPGIKRPTLSKLQLLFIKQHGNDTANVLCNKN